MSATTGLARPGFFGRPEFWLTTAIVVFDQISKALVRQHLPLHSSVSVIPGLFDLTHVRNTGAAFGILNAADFPFKSILLMAVAAGALVAISLFVARQGDLKLLSRLGLALILGGAVGNLIDRAAAGYVIDFVDVYWRDYHFWAFNVADSSITVGATLMVCDMLGLRRNVSTTV